MPDRLETLLDELETLCAQAELSLTARAWSELTENLREQRKVGHALEIELGRRPRTAASDPRSHARLRAILAFRDGQMRQLESYRGEVSTRLRLTRKWKDVARSARAGLGPAPVIFSSVI
ncbi:MAG: hypothetical protein JOY59_09660 [Candidatus Eremiobacteraeota bacterium]|nr:hypothetical protein [Candidatus Eremiobacteraeota bacterium]